MNFLKKTCFVIHQSVTKHILMSLFKAECSERNHLISFLKKNMEISFQVTFILWFQTYALCNSHVKTLIILFNDTNVGPILYFNSGCYSWKIVFFLSIPKYINGNTTRQCGLCYGLTKRTIYRLFIQFSSTRSWRAMMKENIYLSQISFVL